MENGQNSFLRRGCVTNRRDHKCSLWLDFYIKWIPHQLIAWNYLYSMSRHVVVHDLNKRPNRIAEFLKQQSLSWAWRFCDSVDFQVCIFLVYFQDYIFPCAVVPEWCFHSVYPSRANTVLLQKLGSFTGLWLRSLHGRCGNKHWVWHWHDWDWPVAVINGNITMDRIMPARPGPDTQLTYQWQWSEPEPEGGWEILRVKRDYGNPNLRDGWRRLSRLTPQYLALAQTHQFVFRISEDDDVRTEQKQDKLEKPLSSFIFCNS